MNIIDSFKLSTGGYIDLVPGSDLTNNNTQRYYPRLPSDVIITANNENLGVVKTQPETQTTKAHPRVYGLKTGKLVLFCRNAGTGAVLGVIYVDIVEEKRYGAWDYAIFFNIDDIKASSNQERTATLAIAQSNYDVAKSGVIGESNITLGDNDGNGVRITAKTTTKGEYPLVIRNTQGEVVAVRMIYIVPTPTLYIPGHYSFDVTGAVLEEIFSVYHSLPIPKASISSYLFGNDAPEKRPTTKASPSDNETHTTPVSGTPLQTFVTGCIGKSQNGHCIIHVPLSSQEQYTNFVRIISKDEFDGFRFKIKMPNANSMSPDSVAAGFKNHMESFDQNVLVPRTETQLGSTSCNTYVDWTYNNTNEANRDSYVWTVESVEGSNRVDNHDIIEITGTQKTNDTVSVTWQKKASASNVTPGYFFIKMKRNAAAADADAEIISAVYYTV